jgi:hypothetical protein
VVVLRTLGAKERRRRGRRSGPSDTDPEAAPVPTARATVIVAADEFADEAAARSWLRSAGEDDVDRALIALNAAVRAHRLAAADPTVREVGRHQALIVRLGYGTGDEVADGHWSEAREADRERKPRGRRSAVLRPAERLAALLSAREDALACEELTLRARLDLDSAHPREAALQLEAALTTALVELADDDRGDLARRRAELASHRDAVVAAAATARHGELRAEQVDAVATALGRLEAALRARTMAGTAR